MLQTPPQPTHLPPPPPGGGPALRPTPYALRPGIFQERLASVPPNRSNCQSCVPRGRRGLHQLSIADGHFTAGRGGGCPRSGVSHLLCCPAKKKITHKNPGSFLNQPSGVPQREEERDREAERQRDRNGREMKLRRDRKRQEREEAGRDRVDGRRKRRTGQTRRGGERQDRRGMPSIHSVPNQASWSVTADYTWPRGYRQKGEVSRPPWLCPLVL